MPGRRTPAPLPALPALPALPSLPSPPVSRRGVLTGVSAAVVLTSIAPPARAVTDDYVTTAMNGLASYVLPGDDAYSIRQGRTRPGPGGVAAGTAGHLRRGYDSVITVAVAPPFGVNLPGAAGLSAALDLFTRRRFLVESFGPFNHPFANLTHPRKALVLADLDREALLERLPIGYGFSTFITLAANGCFSEFGVMDWTTHRLTGIPVGWRISKHSGVSDGWPEFQGYWGGRQAAIDNGTPAAAVVR
jgi:hypothetical protein